MYHIIKSVATTEELAVINNYLSTAKFNTKEDHVPLHDPLFLNPNVEFDIVTYGDMGAEISFIFAKYCKAIQSAVSELSGKQYDPPILTKSYIMRYKTGTSIGMGHDGSRPENVYRAMVIWNDDFSGGNIRFNNYKISTNLSAGDCIVFPETEEFARELTVVESGNVMISDFWNAPEKQSPYPGLSYNKISWGNPMYDKID
jgi:hypothetical protein